MAKIDARIRDLERAWNDYVHIQPGQTENLYKSRSVQARSIPSVLPPQVEFRRAAWGQSGLPS
jgi:hypothetical protein